MATTMTAPCRTFFDRMIAKSEEQVRAGNLPRLLRTLPEQPNGDVVQVWSVGSRQTAGEIRIVETYQPTDGRPLLTRCDCPAERHCWHQAHVLRALNGEVPFFRTPDRPLNLTRQLADATLPELTTMELFGSHI
ncbi:MAG: hypothetical protein IT340_07005 [Chloroflexi bacterium]|nr:hypothetical protein [Chloroflexota bacterium]